MGDFFTVFGTLLLIVLIFVAAYWFTKFLAKRNKFKQVGSSEKIKILEQMAVGPDRTLLVVKTGGKTLLLGVTAQQVTLIKEFEEGEFPEDPKSQDGEVGSSGFKDVLKSSLKTWGFSSGGKGRKKK